MQKTETIGLNKPDQEDFYNIEDFNENSDKIDQIITELKELLSEFKEKTEEQLLDLQTMIVTGNYFTTIVDADGSNILVDENNALYADWKGVTT